MDVPMAIVGVLFIAWPFYVRRSFARIHGRIRARGGDVERFEAFTSRRLLNVAYWVTAILGVLLIVAAIADP
jgi:hypothetical protein